jgi:Flp pilus assembly protein TadG
VHHHVRVHWRDRSHRAPSRARSRRARPTGGPAPARGQALVEFSLVIPIFLSLLIGLLEFAFIFNAVLATNYASRDAALLAAEGGSDLGADCSVLRAVESDLGAPADPAQIQRVEIFETTAGGAQAGAATVYERRGSFGCTLPDGVAVTVPYTLTADGYPMAARCNLLAGCGGGSTLDHVGVRVTYRHTWRTPFGAGFGPYLDVVKSNSMRMEPVL